MSGLIVVLAALVSAGPAWTLDTTSYRYERPLRGAATDRPTRFVPDRAMYGHAQIGFGDLRIIDGAGEEVPWRALPQPKPPRKVPVRVLEAGRQGNVAVALLDFGARRRLRTRLELDIPDTGFVARVEVLGTGAYARRLSTSVIYDVEGVEGSARSTVVAFPPTDLRYLQLRARGVSRIAGATAFSQATAGPRPLGFGTAPRMESERRTTRIDLDLEHPKVPVDALDVSARTVTYDRPVKVEASNDGKRWELLASARVYRLRDSVPTGLVYREYTTRIELKGRHQFLRITVDNGDDRPLEGLAVATPLAFSRPLLAEGGHPGPVRAFYGDPSARPPVYDLARLPVPGPREVAFGSVGAERLNALFEPPRDTQSSTAKRPLIVIAALALAAAVVGAGLILRRRA